MPGATGLERSIRRSAQESNEACIGTPGAIEGRCGAGRGGICEEEADEDDTQ